MHKRTIEYPTATELQTTHWFNADQAISLASLRGRVVLIEVFQMLCPGCVSHGVPQAKRVANLFSSDDVCVLGLHSVFEHHDVQGTRQALGAFLDEYDIAFPVGMDAPSEDLGIPKTMKTYQMQGTPTLLLIDRQGRLRKQKFGLEDDMALGAEIMALVGEVEATTATNDGEAIKTRQCDASGCSISSPAQNENR